jgi:hypothetical protein
MFESRKHACIDESVTDERGTRDAEIAVAH